MLLIFFGKGLVNSLVKVFEIIAFTMPFEALYMITTGRIARTGHI